MIQVINEHIAPIRILYEETSVIIAEKDSFVLPINAGIIKIERISLESDCFSNKLFSSILNKNVLNINCVFHLEKTKDNALITVKNIIREQVTDDFGYQYFAVSAVNCECCLIDCELINQKDVLRMQQTIRMGEACDIPPFTTAKAIHKYNKIRKMCSYDRVLRILQQEESC